MVFFCRKGSFWVFLSDHNQYVGHDKPLTMQLAKGFQKDRSRGAVRFKSLSRCAAELISHNVLVKWFEKVHSPHNCQLVVYYYQVDGVVGELIF